MQRDRVTPLEVTAARAVATSTVEGAAGREAAMAAARGAFTTCRDVSVADSNAASMAWGPGGGSGRAHAKTQWNSQGFGHQRMNKTHAAWQGMLRVQTYTHIVDQHAKHPNEAVLHC